MNGPNEAPPAGVPTLTEVVAWPAPPPSDEPATAAMPFDELPLPQAPEAVPAFAQTPLAAPPAAPAFNEEQIAQRVLSDVQRQIDLMLDYRLREILTPILTRATDGVIREARAELASTLRDVVTRAVAQELARHRTR